MASSVGDVVAQLKAVIERIDKMAVASAHAQADAYEAHRRYAEASRGTDRSDLNNAVTITREAAEKAGRVARLLAEAKGSLVTYVNAIAPGSVLGGALSSGEMPSGGQLVEEAERRARRAEFAWRKQLKQADDVKDSLERVESGGKAVFNYFKDLRRSPGSDRVGTASPTEGPQLRPAPDPLHVDHPITATIMAAAATAVAAKSTWDHFKRRRAMKRKGEDET
jgi:hypothetical protein